MKEIKISDIKGFRIGHAQSIPGGTGCTAIICDKGAVAGMDVRGGSPASRESELLRPVNTVDKVHCVMLSGGSAYGLAAGDGAMKYLEEKGIGFDVTCGVVPIVVGASLFDLWVGDFKCRPDSAMGYEACKSSEKNEEPEQGNAGAGTGAAIGKLLGEKYAMKSGIGIYAAQIGKIQCGAIVAVNALGDVFDYDSHKQIAGMLNKDKNGLSSTQETLYEYIERDINLYAESINTTLGCIITNARLTKSECTKIAQAAHDGFAQTIRPVHTSVDGDTIFLASAGDVEVYPDSLSAMATEVIARAVNNAVRNARSAYGLTAACDLK